MNCSTAVLVLAGALAGNIGAVFFVGAFHAPAFLQAGPRGVPAGQATSPAAPGTPIEKQPTTLSKTKDVADIVHSFFTIAGIVVGGYWTWMLFVKKRQKYPRAKVTHAIAHKPLAHGQRLLHVATSVSNPGEVLLCLVSGFTRVQQVLPVPHEFAEAVRKGEDPVKVGETEYAWPLLGERTWNWQAEPHEIEPGESEEIHCDFVVDNQATTLEIYTYFRNKEKPGRQIGWNVTTLYDL